MKLLILTVILAVVQTSPPVPRQTTNGPSQTPSHSQKNASDNQYPISTATASGNASQRSVSNQQPTNNPTSPNAEQTVRVRELPSVSVSRNWADWILWGASGVLAVVSILGICVAIKTLKALKLQTRIMARQTVATRVAAQAAEKSVRLQEVAMRQWVKTSDWDANKIRIFSTMKDIPLQITFNIINQTKMPLTLQSITYNAEGKTFSFGALDLLGPDDTHQVKIPLLLTDPKKVQAYAREEFTVSISGSITYMDAFENLRTDPFGCVCRCGPNWNSFNPYSKSDQKNEKS